MAAPFFDTASISGSLLSTVLWRLAAVEGAASGTLVGTVESTVAASDDGTATTRHAAIQGCLWDHSDGTEAAVATTRLGTTSSDAFQCLSAKGRAPPRPQWVALGRVQLRRMCPHVPSFRDTAAMRRAVRASEEGRPFTAAAPAPLLLLVTESAPEQGSQDVHYTLFQPRAPPPSRKGAVPFGPVKLAVANLVASDAQFKDLAAMCTRHHTAALAVVEESSSDDSSDVEPDVAPPGAAAVGESVLVEPEGSGVASPPAPAPRTASPVSALTVEAEAAALLEEAAGDPEGEPEGTGAEAEALVAEIIDAALHGEEAALEEPTHPEGPAQEEEEPAQPKHDNGAATEAMACADAERGGDEEPGQAKTADDGEEGAGNMDGEGAEAPDADADSLALDDTADGTALEAREESLLLTEDAPCAAGPSISSEATAVSRAEPPASPPASPRSPPAPSVSDTTVTTAAVPQRHARKKAETPKESPAVRHYRSEAAVVGQLVESFGAATAGLQAARRDYAALAAEVQELEVRCRSAGLDPQDLPPLPTGPDVGATLDALFEQ